MKDTTQLEIKKPLSWYNRKIKTDFKKVFIALTKSALMVKIADPRSALKEFVDAFNALDFKSDAPGLAYRLVLTSMINAAYELSVENRDFFKEEFQYDEKLYDNPDYIQFLDGLNKLIEDKTLHLNKSVFDNPRHLSLLTDFGNAFKKWLIFAGVENAFAENIANRLPAYFVLALNDEWRSNPSEYQAILQKVDTPFTDAANRELDWRRYNAFLEKQVEEPVFGESFSLRQIFIPLRAYKYMTSEEKEEHEELPSAKLIKSEREKIPFFLTEELAKWLVTEDQRYAIKFISGGPGSGKSSFAKMWCADLVVKNNIRVLYIPLQLFDFESDIEDAIGKFVQRYKDIKFPFNPLKLEGNAEKLLLVFDGLDELSQQGKYATEVANNFVTGLDRYSSQINGQKDVRVLFLIVGRELAVQANTTHFKSPEFVFHLLPYFTKNTSDIDKRHHDFIKIDQRNEWWTKFGKLKGRDYSCLPKELNIARLDEITAQPFLNYLVALSLIRGKLDFANNTNLNEIYKDLIEGVYDRAYEKNKGYEPIKSLQQEDFKRILEEIAVSAWHGGDARTTTLRRIQESIERNNLRPLLDRFEQDAEKGIIRLLTAFYFRQQGITDGDRTFEFTHKSFGEYLTAVRLVKLVKRISEEMDLRASEYDRGWGEEEALKKWMEVTCPTPIDAYLNEYIRDEVAGYPIQSLEKWQSNFAKLLSWVIRNGMPMPEPRQNHKKEAVLNRNSGEALLVCHSACGNFTHQISEIPTNAPFEFGAWLSILQPQRQGPRNVLGFMCLNNLNLTHFRLDIKDLYGSNFNMSKLDRIELIYSNLHGANLQRASLCETSLGEANLEEAHLEEAHLEGAHLEGANLKGAHLEGAHLEGAHLEGAHLKRANLKRANLEGANLEGADLRVDNFDGIQVKRAKIKDAVFNNDEMREKFLSLGAILK